MSAVRCDSCGADCVPSGITTGYGTDADGSRHCFACCGERDRLAMVETGRACLYLVKREGKDVVTNWPGTLSIPAGYVRRGRHNFARVRYDFGFTGPDGKAWRGTVYGDNTQVAHCRRARG